jgi:hypothetical protein
VGDGDIAYVHEIGNKAALDAVRIYKTIRVYNRDPKLSVMQSEMSIPLEKRYSVEFSQSMLKQYEGETVNLRGSMRRYFEKVLKSYDEGYADRATKEVPHNLLVLGE